MRDINLLGLEMVGFRSFCDPIKIDLTADPGFKFMGGLNKVDTRLGANGAGKSTIWDAVSYCLTGLSVKGVRASDLLSWRGKEISVTTHWRIDRQLVSITRQGIPDRLWIDDQPVAQIEVDRLIGLSRARFLQSIIFGQAVPLFIDLAIPQRSRVLDEILDLEIWSKASEIAAAYHARALQAQTAAEAQIARIQGKLEGLPNLDDIQADIDGWQDRQDAEILLKIEQLDELEKALEENKTRLLKANQIIQALPQAHDMVETIRARQRSLSDNRSQQARLGEQDRQTRQLMDFYRHTKICPECAQDIAPEHAVERLSRFQTIFNDLAKEQRSNDRQIDKLVGIIKQLEEQQEEHSIASLQTINAQSYLRSEVKQGEKARDGAARQIEQMMAAPNPHAARLAKAISDRENAIKELMTANAARRRAQGQLMQMDFWRDAFKRVRLFMVNRIMLELEIATQSAAQALGLISWRIGFTTELETKSGSIRPGVHITVASPTSPPAPWEVWSGGEGQRVRLAVSLGLASLIQRMAGISIGFEVWDEPSAWLSGEGIEDLLDCLRHRAIQHHKSLWLCDHRALLHAGFDEVWQVTKTAAGSQMQRLANREN